MLISKDYFYKTSLQTRYIQPKEEKKMQPSHIQTQTIGENVKNKLYHLLASITVKEVLVWRNEFEPAVKFAQQGGNIDLWVHWYVKKPPLMFQLSNEYNEFKLFLSNSNSQLEEVIASKLGLLWHILKLNEDIENRLKRWDKMLETGESNKDKRFFLANEIALQWGILRSLLCNLLVSFQMKS